jgi:ubiquinone/menaquinone biosynthesis C-methylase UbiE
VNCDPIARAYRWLEYLGFGGALQRTRCALLPEVADARRILVLGEGDGRFLARLVEQNPSAAIDYVDLSQRMLELARERAGTTRVTYHQGDALTIPLPAGEYDLIVCHFFLDCLNEAEAEALIDRMCAAAKSGARWLISEFRQETAWARAFVRTLYLLFRVTSGLRTTSLVDHDRLLTRRGFRLESSKTAHLRLLVSQLWTRAAYN